MIYQYNKLFVELSPQINSFLKQWMITYDYRVETGGILVGKIESATPTGHSCKIIITDITGPQLGDQRYPYRFIRAETGHQKKMDELWESSGHKKMYLGEWHTHREARPHPSSIDTQGWKKIAAKKQNSPWMVFLILGTKQMRLWTVHDGKTKELSACGE